MAISPKTSGEKQNAMLHQRGEAEKAPSVGEVERAYASSCRLRNLAASLPAEQVQQSARRLSLPLPIAVEGSMMKAPRTSVQRLEEAHPDSRLAGASSQAVLSTNGKDLRSEKGPKTFLYLAYGSNLAASTFLGSRGIRPLSSVNIVCPSLRLTFDLPGLPYKEPCFANTARRDPDKPEYDNPNGDPVWDRGLVGVVYEVTREDYVHIIATEGGGTSYKDIQVICYPLIEKDGDEIPKTPVTQPFLAHTLFAPYEEDAEDKQDGGAGAKAASKPKGRFHRSNPTWAQASPRYLNLLITGSQEHALPATYIAYLTSLQPYEITSPKQRLGQVILLSTFGPFLFLLLGLMKLFADNKGKAPAWLAWFSAALFEGMWRYYDRYLKPTFGEGERTIGGEEKADSRLVNTKDELEKRSWSGLRRGSVRRDEEEVLIVPEA